jgi:hypothetical protein
MMIDDWLTDIQENGDDGTGHCDDVEIVCDYCEAGMQKIITTKVRNKMRNIHDEFANEKRNAEIEDNNE